MFFRTLVLVIIIGFCGSLGSQGQNFVKAQGARLVDGKGHPLLLRGMGLGGWMLQEGYMFRLGSRGQQYRIKEGIQELIGPEKREAFYKGWLTHHTRKIDIDSMAAWGFNSIRLPMHYNLYTLPIEQEPVAGQNTWLEEGFALTDSLLSWCEANQVYLILDLHAAPGGQGNDLPISDRNPAQPSLWQSEANQQKTIALWRKLAERYANKTWIAGFDLINEPNWGFQDAKDTRGTEETRNEPLRKLMVAITQAIREVDKNHLIIIEGNGFGNNYRGLLPTWDPNMALSFHKYGNFNTQEAIQSFLNLRKEHQVPLWLGESGENSNTWFTDAIRLMEKNDMGWCWWQEKKMGINNPLEIRVTPGYEKLLAYWNGKGPKPSEAEASQTLNELLELLKLENNRYHPDVVDAMFRQVHSAETRPFKTQVITKQTVIKAVDFDLGRQRSAYFDTDSASYHYTPGVNTVGNRGHQYRNDGVDIEKKEKAYVITHTQPGEWVQYTVEVEKSGAYEVKFRVTSPVQASLALSINGKMAVPAVLIPAAKDQWVNTASSKINLKKGKNTLKVQVLQGGFEWESFQLSRLNR